MSVWNSSQLLSIPFESEVLLPIRYQIFDDVLGRCQGVFYKKRAFYFEGVWLVQRLIEHLGINPINYFLYRCVGRCLLGAIVQTFGMVWLIGPDRHLYGHLIFVRLPPSRAHMRMPQEMSSTLVKFSVWFFLILLFPRLNKKYLSIDGKDWSGFVL